jgi:hypothetical protein
VQVPQLYDGDTGAEAVILTTEPPEPVHDVAVTGIGAPASVEQGTLVNVDVTVANEGNQTETFTVSLTVDGGGLGTQGVADLAPGGTTVLTFPWDTADAGLGPHTLTAVADTVPGETDIADNEASATVNVTDPGSRPTIGVGSLEVTLATAGINTYAVAAVTIVEEGGQPPVEGATVTVQWSGDVSATTSGLTDAAGHVSLSSPKIRRAASGTTFTATVTNVVKAVTNWDGVQPTDDATVGQ